MSNTLATSTAAPADREDGECDSDSDSPVAADSSSDDDSDSGKIQQRAIILPRKRKVVPPVAPIEPQQPPSTVLARKKYNIWTEKIREDSLTETMRNFGVNRDGGDSRNVEWYDHTLGNRFAKDGKTNRLKRRRHSGGRRRDGDGDDQEEVGGSDQDGDSMDMDCSSGKRVCYNNNSKQNRARVLADLEAPEEATLEEVAKEIAANLKEANEGLIGG